MEKTYNPEEISSTLEADDWNSSENRRESTATTNSSQSVQVKQQPQTSSTSNSTPQNQEKKVERKLPDWMIKAGQETSKAVKSPKKPEISKPKKLCKPEDIYIMSDEDLLDVARYFIKNK